MFTEWGMGVGLEKCNRILRNFATLAHFYKSFGQNAEPTLEKYSCLRGKIYWYERPNIEKNSSHLVQS